MKTHITPPIERPPVAIDQIFSQEDCIEDFQFNKSVAEVFDDMVDRSVPFYSEIQRMARELALAFAEPNTNLYDLGCATGTTLLELDKVLPTAVEFTGVDASPEMLERCTERIRHRKSKRPIRLETSDLCEDFAPDNASVIIMILTLQFVRPLRRDKLLKRLYDGLNKNGCFLLVEKVLGESSIINRHYIDFYYDLKKRNGYSELEISQKREALENVLVPYRLEENKEMLERAGFRSVDVFFKWYNFCGILAVK